MSAVKDFEKVETKATERHYLAVIIGEEVVIKQASKNALAELKEIYSANDGAKAIDFWATDSKAAFERVKSVYTNVKRVRNGRSATHTDEITEFTFD